MLFAVLDSIIDDLTTMEFQIYEQLFQEQVLPQFYSRVTIDGVSVYEGMVMKDIVRLSRLVKLIYDGCTFGTAPNASKGQEIADLFTTNYPYGYQHGLDMPTKLLLIEHAMESFIESDPGANIRFSSALDMVNISNGVPENVDFLRRCIAIEEEHIVAILDLSSSKTDDVIFAVKAFVSMLNEGAWLKLIAIGCETKETAWMRVENLRPDFLDALLDQHTSCSVLFSAILQQLNNQYRLFNPLRARTQRQDYYSFDEKFLGFIFSSEADVLAGDFDFPVTLYLVYSYKRNPPISAMKGFRNFQFLFDRHSGARETPNYVFSYCDALPETSIVNKDLMFRLNLLQGAGGLYAATNSIDAFQQEDALYFTAPVYASIAGYGTVLVGCATLKSNIEKQQCDSFVERRKFLGGFQISDIFILKVLSTTQSLQYSYTIQNSAHSIVQIDLQMFWKSFGAYQIIDNIDRLTVQEFSGRYTYTEEAPIRVFKAKYCGYSYDDLFLYSLTCDIYQDKRSFNGIVKLIGDSFKGTSDILVLLNGKILVTHAQITQERIISYYLYDLDIQAARLTDDIILHVNILASTAYFTLNKPVVQIDSGIQMYQYTIVQLYEVESRIFAIRPKADYAEPGAYQYFFMTNELNLHPQFEHLKEQFANIRAQIMNTNISISKTKLPLPEYCTGNVWIIQLFNYYYVQMEDFSCSKQILPKYRTVDVAGAIKTEGLMSAMVYSKHYHKFYFDNQISILTNEIDVMKQRLIAECQSNVSSKFDSPGSYVFQQMMLGTVSALLLGVIGMLVCLCS